MPPGARHRPVPVERRGLERRKRRPCCIYRNWRRRRSIYPHHWLYKCLWCGLIWRDGHHPEWDFRGGPFYEVEE